MLIWALPLSFSRHRHQVFLAEHSDLNPLHANITYCKYRSVELCWFLQPGIQCCITDCMVHVAAKQLIVWFTIIQLMIVHFTLVVLCMCLPKSSMDVTCALLSFLYTMSLCYTCIAAQQDFSHCLSRSQNSDVRVIKE